MFALIFLVTLRNCIHSVDIDITTITDTDICLYYKFVGDIKVK